MPSRIDRSMPPQRTIQKQQTKHAATLDIPVFSPAGAKKADLKTKVTGVIKQSIETKKITQAALKRTKGT